MRPFLIHGYLTCCILAGHILVIASSMSLAQYESHFSHGYGILSSKYTQEALDYPPLSYNEMSCEELGGVGSFDTTCLLTSDVNISSDLYVLASGNIEILPRVLIACPVEGCVISFNLSGNIKVGENSAIIAGSVIFSAANMTMGSNSVINTTAMGGAPPSQTSGTPVGYEGAGGGHGGRGATCYRDDETKNWGGDVYAWSTLPYPWSYGSKGGGTSDEHKLGGNGGGRVKLIVMDLLYMNGSLLAEGGYGGLNGGGGSGGSIVIHALKLKGFGIVSASGGSGWGGGGGGRISLDCHSKQEDIKVKVHGGQSIGCPVNGGAAGTCFDSYLLSLRVDNDNVTTETETPLLDFSTSPLWTNVYIENDAKVLVPLRWTRVQVRGQIKLACGGSIIFGLSEYPVSEFELVAEELLMSDSIIKVYGALRATFKMVLMWNAQIQVDGGGSTLYTISVLEVRNLIVLRENSSINSNTNLAVYGQGLLRLSGQGDAIRAQRLSLSLFYNITIGPGSLLEAPIDDDQSRTIVTKSHCENPTCPRDLIYPPDDCHYNDTLSFSLQICRVEDIVVNGMIKGSIIQIHRAMSVIVDTHGIITASELGCQNGFGLGNYSNGAGGGAGHGGRGGSGLYRGRLSEGGSTYGRPDLPCELGSGALGPNESVGRVSGGGMIVMGAILWPLTKLDIYGSVRADGQSYENATTNSNGTLIGGLGGGSGGTILLFIQAFSLFDNSSLSVAGGRGVPIGGGGGGGGRVHFHWSKIGAGNEYVPLAVINSTISTCGGEGDGEALPGEDGTITGKECPKGLYGTFCDECPVGTFKDVEGSDYDLCTPCSLEQLPRRAYFIHVRGGVSESFCPYKCRSDKYKMPNCYTPLEELIYTFGGPWPFALMLSCIVVLLGLLLSTLRVKLVGQAFSYEKVDSVEHSNHHHMPSLLSLSQVRGTRGDETQSHVYRMYFMGPNTFREPWHLPYSPPDAIIDIVYEDSFNRFIDEVNSVAAYDWWEGSVHSILSLLAYPCGWSWKQWRRKYKINRLQEFVKSEYDHSCLRSCRSRALYKGMKVGATPDLVVAYIDFFLGGDEKRLDMVTSIQKRFPMCILFGGAGSYMSPYNLHSDTLLTSLIGQHVPATVWNRLVAGLNAQLRTVRSGSIRSALVPVINWIKTHANPQLDFHGVKIELGWFQATASGFYQLGILVIVGDDSYHNPDLIGNSQESPRHLGTVPEKSVKQLQPSQPYTSHALTRKRVVAGGVNGGIINDSSLKSLEFQRDYLFPFYLFLHNTKPTGCQYMHVLLNCVIDAGLIEVAYVLIKANHGMGTTKYENVKHPLVRTVENFYLYCRQPEESRIFDQSLAKKLQLELRDTVDQGELSSCFESEPLLNEVQDFPESEVKNHKPLLLLRTLCNQLRQKYTLFNTHNIFMEAAVLSVRLDVIEALEELTLHFPDAIKIKHEGHHLIETAVSYRSKKVMNYWANKNSGNMFHLLDLQSDYDDNNVLHLAAMLAPSDDADEKSNTALWLHKEVMWFKKVETLLHPLYTEAKNKNGETPMMVFTREHEELRKHAEKLMRREAKVHIAVAMLIVVILIGAFIKFIIEDDIINFIKTKMLFFFWGVSISVTAQISLINSLSIIESPFRVEDFEYLPSKEKRGRTNLLSSLKSMLVACGILLLIPLAQQLFLMFARIPPLAGMDDVFSFFPACWFMLSKLKSFRRPYVVGI